MSGKAGSSSSSSPSPSKNHSTRELGEKITITGLHETTNPKEILKIRILFGISLILAFSFSIYAARNLCMVNNLRIKHTDIRFMTNKANNNSRVEYPNITICAMALFGNETEFNRSLIIPQDVQDALKKRNISNETLIEQIKLFFAYNSGIAPNLNQTLLRYVLASAEAVFDNAGRDYLGLMMRMLPKCAQILNRCWLNGILIDCCRDAVFSIFPGGVCYKILTERHRNLSSSAFTNNNNQETLVIDASKNWTEELVVPLITEQSDAFFVLINEVEALMAGNPIAVANHWQTFITISRPKITIDRTSCIDERMLPVMHDYEYYDQDGVAFVMENLNRLMDLYFNCHMPFHLGNHTKLCDAAQGYLMITILTRPSGTFDRKTETILLERAQKYIEQLQKGGGVAKPICRRWQYPTTVSYAERLPGEEILPIDQNVSLSRITLTLETGTYEIHTEQEPQPIYVLLSNIAGVFGVGAGFSAITFVQLIWYAPSIVTYFKLKLLKQRLYGKRNEKTKI